MELGARLRQARLEAGLSQRQLCGSDITRNMLSQIENGAATPSIDTLRILAGRLGKPVGYFLEEQAVVSPNQAAMAQARAAYAKGDWAACLQALEGYREPDETFDPERYLLEALSRMALAEAAVDEGKPAYAAALLEQARQAGAKTPYYGEALERHRLLLLATAEPDAAAEIVQALPDLSPELLLRAEAALSAEDYPAAAALLDAVQGPKSARWRLLRGTVCQAQADYAAAATHYAHAEDAYPAQVLPRLEACYSALRDFEKAYLCATKRRQMGI